VGRRKLLKVHIAVSVGLALLLAGTWLYRTYRHSKPVASTGKLDGTPASSGGLCEKIFETTCHGRRPITKDPTGTVGRDVDAELELLRHFEGLVRENPRGSKAEIDEALAARVYSEVRRERVIATFRWVVDRLARILDDLPETTLTRQEKALLSKRIRNTELELPPPASIYADDPGLITRSGVFYERLANHRTRMRVGGAYLIAVSSQYNLVFTIAHELGHSIDPCEVKSLAIAIPSYDRLNACFLAEGWVETRRNRQECGENDQLSEAFADWIAAQVVADAMEFFAADYDRHQLQDSIVNSVRDLCEQGESLREPDSTFHPTPQVRIERIFGHQPKLRALLGCARKQPYCGFDWTRK